MSWKNPQDWQTKRIAELEHSNEALFERFRVANEETSAIFNRVKQEERKRLFAESQVQELREKADNLNLENRQLRKEIRDQEKLQDSLNIAVGRIKELEKQLNKRSGREEPYGLATPSSKRINKVNSTPENRGKRGGARPGHKGHGRKEFPTEEADKIVSLDVMPDGCECGENNWNPKQIISHSVYRFIPARVEKCIYRKLEYVCTSCGRHASGHTPGVIRGALYGNAMIAHLLTEHYCHGQTAGSLVKRWNINRGSLFQLAHRTATQLEKCFEYILFRFRQDSRLVHADETPWAMDGAKGYAWFFGNDDFKIFILRHTRSSEVPKAVLGSKPLDLVLITDRYSGYTVELRMARQYCYVHLLRDLKKEEQDFPNEAEVQLFAAELSPRLAEAVSLRNRNLSLEDYRQKARQLQQEIETICDTQARHPAVQHIQNIFRENRDKMFQWVNSPEIPADNNFAERELRPTVIARKISFGSQAERGLKTRETLMTILHTARCRGLDPAQFLENALNLISENKPDDILQMLFPAQKKENAA